MSEHTDNIDATQGYKDLIKEIQRADTLPRYEKRHELIRKGEETGDPLVDMFFQDPLPDLVKDVLKLRYTKHKKMYVEACLLATHNTEKIAQLLGVSTEVVDAYRSIYYDIDGIDKLDKLRLVECVEDKQEQHLKLWALSQGLDFISWRLGEVPKISPVEGLTSLYSDCFFKAKEAFYNPNTAESSKEGMRWAKQATDIARLLKAWVSDVDEATRDINLALMELTGGDVKFPTMDELEDGQDLEEASFQSAEYGDAEGIDEIPDFPSIDDLGKDD